MDGFRRYTVKRKIDSGGMATVFLAEDTSLHRAVALKMIHPHLLDHPDALKRFENEARAIASLSHENIVRLFDYGEEDDRRYLVMEYVDGQTLRKVMESSRSIPNLALLELFLQVYSGLAAAHDLKILHRDIKPANIMVDKYGTVKIMDFGIASMLNTESLTVTGTFVGSPNYVSPEQGGGRKSSPKSDIFAAGAVFYECACGAPAFEGDNPHSVIYSIINTAHEPAFQRNPRLLHDISTMIDRCLSKDPMIRPDARACVAGIEKICHDERLTLGKNRLARFTEDSPAYVKSENKELFEYFREKARAEYRGNRMVSCLRHFTAAERFDSLDPADRRVVERIGRGVRVRRRFLAGAAIAALLSLCYYGWTLVTARIAERNAAHRFAAPAPVPIPQARGSLAARTAGTATSSAVRAVKAPSTPAPRRSSPVSGAPAAREIAVPAPKAYVTVKTNPPYAEFLVDGLRLGVTPIMEPVPLEPASHRVVLRKENFVPVDTLVNLSPRDTVRLEIALRKRSTNSKTSSP